MPAVDPTSVLWTAATRSTADADTLALSGPVLFPPVDYSPGWIALAAGIVVAIVAFYVLVPLLTRARERPEPIDTEWIPDEPPLDLRAKYLDLIGDVETSHGRGELSLRAAHQRLSLLLRFFAYEQSGLGAPQMTLADLRSVRAGEAAGARQLVGAVESLYPGAFEAVERGSVTEAADQARRVVQTWN